MAYCCLDFQFEDQPKWRESEQPTTATMVKEIVNFRDKFIALPESDKEFCSGSFSRAMAVECIYHSNIGELVGYQTKKGTKELLMSYFHDTAGGGGKSNFSGVEASETLNTHAAMTKLYQNFKEMEGFLTVQQICEVHEVLMDGLHRDAGKIRETEAYTIWAQDTYFYPKPEDVEARFYAVVDRYSIHVGQLSSIAKNSKEEVEHVFKCAARLLFDFVDTHPFGDGNGRMCRLLANYVLNLITPFPVGIYHTDTGNKKGGGRTDYINAIVQCRDNRDEGPRDLAAMLIEGAWNGWKTLFKNLYSRSHNCVDLVVQASKLENVPKNVRRILARKELSLNEEEVSKLIIEAVKEMDVEKLKEFCHIEYSVKVASQTYIKLNVFK